MQLIITEYNVLILNILLLQEKRGSKQAKLISLNNRIHYELLANKCLAIMRYCIAMNLY